MRRICLLLASWLLLFSGVPVVQAQFSCATNAGQITITGYLGTNDNVIIPSKTNGLPVTAIGLEAFYQLDNITNVTMPASVTNIESGAFSDCSNLAEVTLGGYLTNIADYAFSGDVSLVTVTIASNVISIGAYAFANCYDLAQTPLGSKAVTIEDDAFANCFSLTNVIIADSVTNIGPEAFNDCVSLTSLALGTNVNTIGANAFADCIGLTNVTIPASATNIGDGAFVDCMNLTAINVDADNAVYTSMDGVLFNKSQTTLIQYPAGSSADSYSVPKTVTTLGDYAFADGQVLTSIAIPASVTNIGMMPFQACLQLTTIGVNASNAFYSSAGGVLFDKSQTMLIQYPQGKVGPYTIPDSVITIADHAFTESFGLNNITIGSGVSSIGAYAFAGCLNLTNVTMGGNVANIGDEAFYQCNSLKKVYFLGNAPSADATVFYDQEPYSYDPATIYYLPGTTGWGTNYAGLQTAIWVLPYPVILGGGPDFGVQSAQFGFTVSWAINLPVIVEACTNLASPEWVPLQTNTTGGGSFYFSDPEWTNYPGRFYRVGLP